MEHIKWDLGTVKKGSVVVVRLRNQGNVLLMDSNNYRAYARGARARYYGGLAKTSPVQLAVPGDGHWFVAIDLGGASGRIDAGVVVQPPPRGSLPPIRQGGSLNAVRHGVPEAPPSPNVN